MIYDIYPDVARVTEGGVYDAEIIRFPGWENVSFFYPDVDERERGAPALIEYNGNLSLLRDLDYPYTPNQGLLVSKRLVQTLLSVRPFPHELFPARIYSNFFAPLLRDDTGHRTDAVIDDPTAFTDEFVILKLATYTDCLDKDRTTVDGIPFRRTGEAEVDFIRRAHYEFAEPPDGFPPVFVTPEIAFYGFSEQAKSACERAGLKGVRLRPVQ